VNAAQAARMAIERMGTPAVNGGAICACRSTSARERSSRQ
jgi:hypothetical protein